MKNMSDRQIIEAVFELINDYGVGLCDVELRTEALALIAEGQAARERAAIMAKHAAYALRYRNGEDLATLQKTCRVIVHIQA